MKRKINVQKVFNAVSIVFLSICFLVYGIRFLTLYIKSARKMTIEANTVGNKLKLYILYFSSSFKITLKLT